jgi:F-type H+-transporting ATPase subunit b
MNISTFLLVGKPATGGMINLNFTMVMQVINFGVLMYLLTKLLYKPVLDLLDKRAEKVKEDLDNAAAKDAEAQKVLDQYRDQLDEIRGEVHNMLAEARKDADSEKHKIINAAQAEARSIMDKAKADIESQVEKAHDTIKKTIAEVSIDIAEKVIEKSLSEKDNKEIVDQYLSRVEASISK